MSHETDANAPFISHHAPLPNGYKQTEVGIIPEDWGVVTLGESANIVRGGSPRPAGDPKYFNGNFIPWLTVAALTNIPESQNYVSETVGFLTEEGSKHSRILPKNTLIIANSGATLGVAKMLAIKCCANDGIAALLDVNKSVDKLFLCHYLNTLTKFLREVVATGNGQPNLNTELIGNVTVPLPPMREQQAIAAVLSDADALITALDQIIAKKRNLKQGAMQLLLTGKNRLPGFRGAWDTKTLGELGKFRGGNGFPEKYQNVSEGKFPFFKVSDMNNLGNEVFMINSNNYISAETRKAIGAYLFPANTIIFAKIGAAIFLERKRILKQISCIDNNVMGFILDSGNSYLGFIFYQLLSIEFGKLVSTSALPSLGSKEVSEIEIPFPPIEEQQGIARVLSAMDAEIAALEQQREKYQVLKQGMMQELLTGRTRLMCAKFDKD